MKCPYCGKETNTNKCPKCLAEIPIPAPTKAKKQEEKKDE